MVRHSTVNTYVLPYYTYLYYMYIYRERRFWLGNLFERVLLWFYKSVENLSFYVIILGLLSICDYGNRSLQGPKLDLLGPGVFV